MESLPYCEAINANQETRAKYTASGNALNLDLYVEA
jgi:hypothetical protein